MRNTLLRNFIIVTAALCTIFVATRAAAQMSVSATGPVAGSGNQYVDVDVVITNPSSVAVDAFGLQLSYPVALMDFIDVDNTGTLTAPWLVVGGSEVTPGTVTIGGFHTTPITSSGVLLRVRFQLLPTAVGNGSIALSAFLDDLAGASTSPATVTVSIGPGAAGLFGDYYDNINFTAPYMTRVDPLINFNWGTDAPDPGMGKNDFSIRWTGWVVADYSETYTFHTITDDGVRVWVDNTLIIDRWVDQSPTEWTGTIALTAGVLTPIQVDYYEKGGGAVAQLLWSSTSVEKATIPANNMLAAPCGQGMGDVNGDALLSSADALCAFDIFVNNGVLAGTCNFQNFSCELSAADVNCDALVTPNDAREIELRVMAALAPATCFAQGFPSSPPAPFDIALSQQVLNGVGQLRVTLAAVDPAGLDAFGLRLAFPAGELQFDRIESAYATGGWFSMDARVSTAGELVIGGFDTMQMAGGTAAELFHLYFDFLGAPGPAVLTPSGFVDDFAGATVIGTVTGAGPVATGHRLEQNYPNPFNPTTTIRFILGSAEIVELSVYGVRGERIRTLVNELRPAGSGEARWDGTDERGNPVHSGVYFYRIRAGDYTESRRMVLLK